MWKRANKNKKCDQFFCPTSYFFDFCNPCFFYHTFTNDAYFVDKAYVEICDNSLFTSQFRYIEKVCRSTGDHCSHNKLAIWSQVSWYKIWYDFFLFFSFRRVFSTSVLLQRTFKKDLKVLIYLKVFIYFLMYTGHGF